MTTLVLMKVVISGRYILPKKEGIGRYTQEMIKHLSSSNSSDEYHILLDRDYQPSWLKELPVKTHVVAPQARHPILWSLWYEWSVPRILDTIGADVFFCPEGYLSKKTAVPTVMTVHDLAYLHYPEGIYASHLRYWKKNTRAFVNRADHLIAVSDFTKNEVVQHFPNSEHKMTVIGHGVGDEFRPISKDEQEHTRARLTEGQPYFLYLGSMHPRKNVVRLIEAFELYKKKDKTNRYLVLAGRLAWKSEEIKRKINSSSCRDYIIYESDIEGKIPTLIGTADALCYVSLLEGFGLPVLEAMACGVPVITSRESAMSEVCGEFALYVDPSDVKDIARGLGRVQKDGDTRRSIIKKGLERAARFKWNKAAKEVHNVLQQVARG